MTDVLKSLISLARRRAANLMDRLEQLPTAPTDFECMRQCADAVTLSRPDHSNAFDDRAARGRSRAA